MLKDSDYSTPSDHYFSYMAKNKEDKTSLKDKEAAIMADMGVDQPQMEKLQE